jgi:anti-anti-sigma factor
MTRTSYNCFLYRNEFSLIPETNIVLLQVYGRLTIGEASTSFRETIERLISRGHRRIVVSLEGLAYIDSYSIGELTCHYYRLYNLGGGIRFIGLNQRLVDLIQIHRLYIGVHSALYSAIESLNRAGC